MKINRARREAVRIRQKVRKAGSFASFIMNPAGIALTTLLGAVIGAMLIGLAGCSANEPLPTTGTLPREPVIELIDVSPASVVALQDSLVFYLRYTDGDGDLGFLEADSGVVFLTDERFPLTEIYHVPPMAPEGSGVAVTGIWSVVLSNTIMADPAALSEAATFSIRVRDRAGNWSNTVTSMQVTVNAP